MLGTVPVGHHRRPSTHLVCGSPVSPPAVAFPCLLSKTLVLGLSTGGDDLGPLVWLNGGEGLPGR